MDIRSARPAEERKSAYPAAAQGSYPAAGHVRSAMGADSVQLAEDPGLLVLIDKHNKAAVQKCSAAFGF